MKTVAWAIEDTLRQIHLRVSDDNAITRNLVKGWLDTAISEILPRFLRQRGSIPGSLYKLYSCVVINKIDNECYECSDFYVDLPAKVMPLQNDAGVMIGLPNMVFLNRFKGMGSAALQKKLNWVDRKGFYLIGERIYFVGFNFVTGSKVNVLLLQSMLELTDTDNFPVPAEIEGLVIEAAVMKGLRTRGVQEDKTNDGDENLIQKTR